MARSLILPVAERDILDLFEHHLDHSDRTAHALANAVMAAVERLEQFPESGSPRQEVMDDLRVVVLRRFRANVFYTVTNRDGAPIVTVLRVFRQEREVSKADFQ